MQSEHRPVVVLSSGRSGSTLLQKLLNTHPDLVIWGEQDQALLTGNLDGMQDYVEDLTLERIPDATHWVVHEQPDMVNALIREFIA